MLSVDFWLKKLKPFVFFFFFFQNTPQKRELCIHGKFFFLPFCHDHCHLCADQCMFLHQLTWSCYIDRFISMSLLHQTFSILIPVCMPRSSVSLVTFTCASLCQLWTLGYTDQCMSLHHVMFDYIDQCTPTENISVTLLISICCVHHLMLHRSMLVFMLVKDVWLHWLVPGLLPTNVWIQTW